MADIRTDLAYEAHQSVSSIHKGSIDGVKFHEYRDNGISATKIEITNAAGESITGKARGKYITIKTQKDFTPQHFKTYSEFVSKRIRELLPAECNSVLIAGLGNRFITADSIGPKAISHIIVTRHIKSMCPSLYTDLSLGEVAALTPGVLSQTGIESSDIIKSVINDIKPSCLIAIDALASRTFSHLACMLQLSDCGIAPGSGVNNSRAALNSQTMGIPVVSIGVPTVIDASSIASDLAKDAHENDFECFITLKESDIITDNMAKLIGYSVNLALHGTLSYEEMLSMCS